MCRTENKLKIVIFRDMTLTFFNYSKVYFHDLDDDYYMMFYIDLDNNLLTTKINRKKKLVRWKMIG